MEKKGIQFFGIYFPNGSRIRQSLLQELTFHLLVCPSIQINDIVEIRQKKDFHLFAYELNSTLKEEFTNLQTIISNNKENIEIEYVIEIIFEKKFHDWGAHCVLPSEEEFIFIEEMLGSDCVKMSILEEFDYKTKLLNAEFEIDESPKQIFSALSEYIKGQDNALKYMSTVAFEHKNRKAKSTKPLPKATPLLVGATGSGKTYMVQKMKELLQIESVHVSCANLVPTGIVGISIADVLGRLFNACSQELPKMERSIIVLDEIDKICQNKDNLSVKTNIVSEILSLFDNEEIQFPKPGTRYNEDLLTVNPQNMLIIFAGSFAGIEEIIKKRISESTNTIHFDKNNILEYITTEDLIAFGMLPELAGRISKTLVLRNLHSNAIYEILKYAKDSELTKQIQRFQNYDAELWFTDEALYQIANIVSSSGLGARYINTVLSQLLEPYFFDISSYKSKSIEITAEEVEKAFSNGIDKHLTAAFEETNQLDRIAKQFELEMDEVLDYYLQWKHNKKMEE